MQSKNVRCIRCKGKTLPIIYGLPLEEDYMNPNIILGGCIIHSDSKDYQCLECGLGFNKGDKYTNSETNTYADEIARFTILEKSLESAAKMLEKKYTHIGLSFSTVGGFVPVEATGVFKDKAFYFKFRYDTAYLYIGKPVRKGIPKDADIYSREDVTGDAFNGVLTGEYFIDIFSEILDDVLAVV